MMKLSSLRKLLVHIKSPRALTGVSMCMSLSKRQPKRGHHRDRHHLKVNNAIFCVSLCHIGEEVLLAIMLLHTCAVRIVSRIDSELFAVET